MERRCAHQTFASPKWSCLFASGYRAGRGRPVALLLWTVGLTDEKHHNLVNNDLFQQFKKRSINEVSAGACSSHPYPPAECVDVITGITQVFPQQLVAYSCSAAQRELCHAAYPIRQTHHAVQAPPASCCNLLLDAKSVRGC